MAYTKRLLGLLLLFALGLSALHAKTHTFTDRKGRTLEAEILQIEDSRVFIKRSSGGEPFWLDIALLSDDDRALMKSMQEADKDAFVEMNTLLGIELFADSSLWDDSPASVAERLKWPRESKTDTQSSFRLYSKDGYKVLGARPFSSVLYGSHGRVDSLSLVFANKGDFDYSGDFASKSELRAMHALIEKDSETISKKMTTSLGEGTRDSFGSGSGLRERVERWDWKGHAFLLSVQDGEYVNLKIMSSEMADRKGKPDRISDSELRTKNKANVEKRENGDVILTNIPMVNQGPKGYCVPATFERCLRFMDIPADMYLLAMAGNTNAGGGTYVSSLIESLKGYTSRQNRKVKAVSGWKKIKINTVAKHIDQGTPIIWTMFSNKAYNDLTNALTKKRENVTNWSTWEKEIEGAVDAAAGLEQQAGAHVCLIIGYNKKTEEIATSDSWGPRYEERWVPLSGAQAVSYGSAHYIAY